MYVIFLLSVAALAAAAPRYPLASGRQAALPGRDHFHSYFSEDDLFDTKKFWQELSEELLKLDDALENFYKTFPTTVTEEKVEGNQYKITIPLSGGFSEKDIVVKAREGLLMVQATHRFGNNNLNNYMNLRTLPRNVDVSGTWTYDDNILTIVFPLKATTETTTEVVTEAPQEHSREEMENSTDDMKGDADVGLTRADKDAEILTKQIPNNEAVESTTYAVDISNEIEFVPVRFK